MAPRAGTHAEGNGAAGNALSVPVTSRLRIGMTSIRTLLAIEPAAEPLVAHGMGREGEAGRLPGTPRRAPDSQSELRQRHGCPIARLATQW